ncbi:MAG: DUF4837 family protein [Flavobacteriales bacterium]|nr:DUF4837 family protein [Flavobacteriales bacterium]
MLVLNRIQFYFIYFFIAISFIACNEDDEKRTLPQSAGDIGGVLVVVSDFDWNGDIGNIFREVLAVPLYGSNQAEAEYKFKNVPKEKFKSLLLHYKNIIYIDGKDTGSISNMAFKRDVWAADQVVVQIKKLPIEEFEDVLLENRDEILLSFKQNEIRGLQKRQKQGLSEEISERVNEKFSTSIRITDGFKIVKDTLGFMWCKAERQRTKGGHVHQISLGIMLYELPFEGKANLESDMFSLRDGIIGKHIIGSTPNSYMKTYKGYVPDVREIKYLGNIAYEVRGLWKMENDFMGGPFLTYFIVDQENARVIVLDSYIYAPGFDKRGFLLEMEAILKTMKLTN